MTVYCQKCGSAMPDAARFCSSCGAAVNAAPFAAPFTATHPLVRPIVGRQIGGVCLGVAQCYGWDVAVVRVVALLALCFSGGVIGIAYLAGWIGIPEQGPTLP